MIRGSTFDARAFARALRDEAMRIHEVTLAEVFVRVAQAWRCEIGSDGSLSTRRHAESGVALRLWDRSGREGFVHADDVSDRDIGELALEARSQLSESTAPESRIIPRLPEGADGDRDSAPGLDAYLSELDVDEKLRRWTQWVREADASCSEVRHARLQVREIWIERGVGHTWLVNSLGRDIGFPFELGSAGLHAG